MMFGETFVCTRFYANRFMFRKNLEGNWGITLADLASNVCAKKNWARVFSVLQRTHKFQAPLAKHLTPSHAIFNFICNVLACPQGLGKRDNLKLFDSIMTVKTLVVSLGSKRFQSSYWAKVRAGAKKLKGEKEGRRGNDCPQTHDSGKRSLIFHGSVHL